MKTNELTGAALDWAVAKCEAFKTKVEIEGIVWLLDSRGDISRNFNPSSNWSWGGPIIEEEGISISSHLDGDEWFARDYWGLNKQAAEKPLIAAMRCYVASKLGDEVEIPEEIK